MIFEELYVGKIIGYTKI